MSGKERSMVTPRTKARKRREPSAAAAADKENSTVADNTVSSDSASRKPSSLLSKRQVLKVFLKAAAATSQAEFWAKHSNLAECVVDASVVSFQKTNTTTSLLLQEHTLDILNTSRKLVKESKEAKDSTTTLNSLCVAVHGLVAVCRSVSGGSKQDAAVKLLYHAVTIAEETVSSCKNESDKLRAAAYSLAAYQALGELLKKGYSLKTSKAGETVVFCAANDNDDDDNEKCLVAGMFPVPKRKAAGGEEVGSLTIDLVCSIAVQSTLAAARVLTYLWRTRTTTLSISAALEFQDLVNILHERGTCILDILYLTRKVASTWIFFLAQNAEANCAKEVASLCKQAYRVLWDAASAISKRKEDASDCLLLRRNSIAALILGAMGPQLPSRIRSVLKEKHLETACSYAWKAAVSYAQLVVLSSSEPCSKPLAQFHEEMSSLLSAWGQDNSLGWAEYWVYRALHIGPTSNSPCASVDCMFRRMPFTNPHVSCRVEEGTTHAFVAAFYLALDVKCKLQDIDNVSEEDISAEFIKNARAVISCFQSSVIESKDTSSAANLFRYFKLLSMISLHRVVFDALEREPSSLSEAAQSLLELGADILVESVGPLGKAVLSVCDKSMDEARARQAWDLLGESFIRGISVFEALKSERCWVRANATMQVLVATVDPKHSRLKVPQACTEKVAKFLAVAGKRRFDTGGGAATQLPTLLAIQLWTNSSRYVSVQSIQGATQLSLRWDNLASVYKSQEMIDEAVIATVSALVYDAIGASQESSSVSDDAPLQLVHYLASLTRGALVTGTKSEFSALDQRKRLVTRLVSMLSKRSSSMFEQEDSSKPSAYSASMALDTLLEGDQHDTSAADSFELKSKMPFGMGGLFHSMFATNASHFAHVADATAILVEKLRILADCIVALGSTLQRQSSVSETSYDANVSAMDYLLRLVSSYARKVVSSEDSECAVHVIVGTLYVVASVSVISSLPCADFESWSLQRTRETANDDDRLDAVVALANKFAHRAADSFSKAPVTGSDWGMLACSMRPAVCLYDLQVSSAQSKKRVRSPGDILLHLRNAVDLVKDETEESGFVAASKACVAIVLARLSSWFAFDGETLLAAQIAAWSTETAHGDCPEMSSWFEATALSLSMMDGGVSTPPTPQRSGASVVAVAGTEVRACQLRVILRSASYADANVFRAQLLTILEEIDDLISQNSVEHSPELLQWSRCTVLLGLAEAAEMCGDTTLALSLLRACYSESGRSDRKIVPHEERLTGPLWKQVVMATALIRSTERRLDCLQRIGQLYARVGDHRNAEVYLSSATDVVGAKIAEANGTKAAFSSAISLSRSDPCGSSQEIRIRRSLLYAKARATALDVVLEDLDSGRDSVALSAVQFTNWRKELSANEELEKIKDMLTEADVLSTRLSSVVGDPLQEFCASVKKRLEAFVNKPRIRSLVATPNYIQSSGPFLPSVYYPLRLAEAGSALHNRKAGDVEWESEVVERCREITESRTAPVFCRARAFYYLGIVELGRARRNGELAELWQERSCHEGTGDTTPGESIEKAHEFFNECLPLIGPASELLTRNVLRCLALVTGRERTQCITPMSVCALIHVSIGSGARQHVAMGRQGGVNEENDSGGSIPSVETTSYGSVDEIFRAFDSNLGTTSHSDAVEFFFKDLGKRVPEGWRFVAVALCPTGDLLLNSLEKPENGGDLVSRSACKLASPEDTPPRVHSYEDILKPLDQIVHRSQAQLEGVDEEQAEITSSDESRKREWWNNRKALDADLQSLLERVNHSVFGSEEGRCILLGSEPPLVAKNFEQTDTDSGLTCGNLASRFEAATSLSDTSVWQFGKDEPEQMKVAELREELVDCGIEMKVLRKMRKAELVDLLAEKRRTAQVNAAAAQSPPRTALIEQDDTKPAGCTFLVLDENLHRFPFEGMPSLAGRSVCRLPSLPFALATLYERSTESTSSAVPAVNPNRVCYILDPESNLGATQERIQPFIKSLVARQDWEWQGVVGSNPSSEFVEKSVTATDGLLFFCGHGAGQSYFGRSRINGLIAGDGTAVDGRGKRRCSSTVVLMGCSSGRLTSVNRKNTKSFEELPIHYEPEGIALSYLCAGAPCVVGNLWDVTDRDIDRFSLTMLEAFFESEDNLSLPQSVAAARSSCRMRNLVGCAPVCYGVPVHLLPLEGL